MAAPSVPIPDTVLELDAADLILADADQFPAERDEDLPQHRLHRTTRPPTAPPTNTDQQQQQQPLDSASAARQLLAFLSGLPQHPAHQAISQASCCNEAELAQLALPLELDLLEVLAANPPLVHALTHDPGKFCCIARHASADGLAACLSQVPSNPCWMPVGVHGSC